MAPTPAVSASASRNKRRREDGPASGTGKASGGKNEGLYHCDYCHKDLSSALRIKCAVCKDFDLCLECFSVGVTLNVAGHSNDHAYKVVQSLGFPLYHPAWRADEEMLLLEGIEIYGMGNWPKVAEHVGKGLDECRAHYLSTYIDHDRFPLPKRDASMAALDLDELVGEYRRTGKDLLGSCIKPPLAAPLTAAPAPTPKKVRHGAAAGSGVAPTAGVKLEDGFGVEVKAEAQEGLAVLAAGEQGARGGAAGKKHQVEAAPPGLQPQDSGVAAAAAAAADEGQHRTQGTFQLRPAAPLPAGSPFIVAVTPSAPAGGAKILAAAEAQQTGYNIKRNEFEPEWDAEAESIIAELDDFGEHDTEEEAAEKDRLIAIYNRRLDERERRRQFVLDRGLLNIKRQQAIDKRRTAPERELHGGLRVLARHLPQDQFEALAEGIAVEQRLRARITELQELRAMGLRTFEQIDELEALQEIRRKKEAQQQQQAIRNRVNRVAVDEGALQEALVESIGAAHAAAALGQQHSTLAEGRGNGLTAWRHKRGVLLDITSLPDAEPLNQQERTLCATERYLPAQYLAIKAAVLKQQEQRGRVPRAEILRLPFQVDAQRMQRLHDFFVIQGWISQGVSSAGKDPRQQQQQQWQPT
ncbi:Transcriptional adapter ADA2 [Chlorella vulgaris]